MMGGLQRTGDIRRKWRDLKSWGHHGNLVMIPKYTFWPQVWSHTFWNSNTHRKFQWNTEFFNFDQPRMSYIYFSRSQVSVFPKITTSGSFLITEAPAMTPTNLIKEDWTHSSNTFKTHFAANKYHLFVINAVCILYISLHTLLVLCYF